MNPEILIPLIKEKQFDDLREIVAEYINSFYIEKNPYGKSDHYKKSDQLDDIFCECLDVCLDYKSNPLAYLLYLFGRYSPFSESSNYYKDLEYIIGEDIPVSHGAHYIIFGAVEAKNEYMVECFFDEIEYDMIDSKIGEEITHMFANIKEMQWISRETAAEIAVHYFRITSYIFDKNFDFEDNNDDDYRDYFKYDDNHLTTGFGDWIEILIMAKKYDDIKGVIKFGLSKVIRPSNLNNVKLLVEHGQPDIAIALLKWNMSARHQNKYHYFELISALIKK